MEFLVIKLDGWFILGKLSIYTDIHAHACILTRIYKHIRKYEDSDILSFLYCFARNTKKKYNLAALLIIS